jgi:hypothetical protein
MRNKGGAPEKLTQRERAPPEIGLIALGWSETEVAALQKDD